MRTDKTVRKGRPAMGAYALLPLLLLLLVCCTGAGYQAAAQGSKELVVNLAPLDGVALTPENVFSFTIQSGFTRPVSAVVKGTVRYRQSGLSFSYTLNTTLRSGMNVIEAGSAHPQWAFSSGALRELFMDYHTLPEGTYEYCISVQPLGQAGEPGAGAEAMECLYGKKDDLFLISLVDPENKAKLYEHYPVLSWIVNYPFASQLTYRVRVAEIKEGQNTVGAITRNNPVYQESSLPQTTVTYPVYGEALKTFQPYAWTVDAYYKGILLGGAEPWMFTIIEDSEMVAVPHDQSYYDFAGHFGETSLFAIGQLKLKYVSDIRNDTLSFSVLKAGGGNDAQALIPKPLGVSYADNLFILDLKDKLQHKSKYELVITNTTGKKFSIPFIYYNPLFVK